MAGDADQMVIARSAAMKQSRSGLCAHSRLRIAAYLRP